MRLGLLLVLLVVVILQGVVGQKHYFSDQKTTYTSDKTIPTKTLKLTSIPKAFPFGYYQYHGDQLPFCIPINQKYDDGKCDLGECLSGVLIQDSAYKVCTCIVFKMHQTLLFRISYYI